MSKQPEKQQNEMILYKEHLKGLQGLFLFRQQRQILCRWTHLLLLESKELAIGQLGLLAPPTDGLDGHQVSEFLL